MGDGNPNQFISKWIEPYLNLEEILPLLYQKFAISLFEICYHQSNPFATSKCDFSKEKLSPKRFPHPPPQRYAIRLPT
jgi:hypothetical protein